METDIELIMTRLEPHLDQFDAIMRHGHTIYETYPADVVIDHDASTQAHCIYRHILLEAQRVLDELEGVEHLEIRGQHLWLFKQENVVCRFKKTDENGISTNYPTHQAQDFEAGRELPGLPPAPTRLTVGYLLDDLGVG